MAEAVDAKIALYGQAATDVQQLHDRKITELYIGGLTCRPASYLPCAKDFVAYQGLPVLKRTKGCQHNATTTKTKRITTDSIIATHTSPPCNINSYRATTCSKQTMNARSRAETKQRQPLSTTATRIHTNKNKSSFHETCTALHNNNVLMPVNEHNYDRSPTDRTPVITLNTLLLYSSMHISGSQVALLVHYCRTTHSRTN